jgi:hypothetical protein
MTLLDWKTQEKPQVPTWSRITSEIEHIVAGQLLDRLNRLTTRPASSVSLACPVLIAAILSTDVIALAK